MGKNGGELTGVKSKVDHLGRPTQPQGGKKRVPVESNDV